MKTYPKDQLWELFTHLPEELKEASSSEENGEIIFGICKRNEIADAEKISDILVQINYVFLGILSPNELQKALEEEISLNKKTAKQITEEINKFVFAPVKNSLEELYQIEINIEPSRTQKPIYSTSEEPVSNKNNRKKDIYRENY